MPRSSEKKEVIKLPTVRFRRDLSGEGLLQALQDCGFAYLVDLEPEFGQAFATLLEASKDFFHQLTKEDREVLARGQWRATNAGYIGVGVEALAPESGNRDPKEAFNFVYGDRYEPLETLLPVTLRTAKKTFDQQVLGRLVPLLVDRLGEALERYGWGPTAAAFREAHVLVWPQRPSQRALSHSLNILQSPACPLASYPVKRDGKLGPEHPEAVSANGLALGGDPRSPREQRRTCSNRSSLRANLSQTSEGGCTFAQEGIRSGSKGAESGAPCPCSPRPREQHETMKSVGSVSTNAAKCACEDIDSNRCIQDKVPAELATTLRLLHYPSIPLGAVFNSEKGGNDARIEPVVLAGAHSDYGTFTLLYQDHVGGLELQIGERWVSIEREPTDPFGLLLNIGDMLSLWTRGRISSTVHRVVARARNDARETDDALHLDGRCTDRRVFSEERFSVALFLHPLNDTVVDVVTGRRAVDILNERLGRTYTNLGPCNR